MNLNFFDFLNPLWTSLSQGFIWIIAQITLPILLLGLVGRIMGATMPAPGPIILDALEILLHCFLELTCRLIKLAVLVLPPILSFTQQKLIAPLLPALLPCLKKLLKLLEIAFKHFKGLIYRSWFR